MNPLFKWPGGKSGELAYIRSRTPEHERYVEPFLGGGAVFFDLAPQRALINDINPTLMAAYELIGDAPQELEAQLRDYAAARKQVAIFGEAVADELLELHRGLTARPAETATAVASLMAAQRERFGACSQAAWPDDDELWPYVVASAQSKLKRIANNEAKNGVWADADVRAQIETAMHAGLYTYVRDGFVTRTRLDEVARFLYLREFCYGGMFRFNKQGHFNIPYGGASYNSKSLTSKLNYWFSAEVGDLLRRAEKTNLSFEELLATHPLSDRDFVFLDPPYDTEFSDYDQFSFAAAQQRELADWFARLPCPALMIIGKTDLISELYEQAQRTNPEIVIEEYEKIYSYNVRGRNERGITHLGIRNFAVSDKGTS